MSTVRTHSRAACFVVAMALLSQIAPAMAASDDDRNRPVNVTFTKWGVAAPPLPAPQPPFGLLEGFAGDGLVGSYRRGGSLATSEPERARRWTHGHVRGRRRRPFVHGAHPGRTEFGRRGPLRRRHPGRVARRRASAGRVSEVSRNCWDAELRGGTRQQDVLRGHYPHWPRPPGLSTARAQPASPTRRRGLMCAARLHTLQPGPSLTSFSPRRGNPSQLVEEVEGQDDLALVRAAGRW